MSKDKLQWLKAAGIRQQLQQSEPRQSLEALTGRWSYPRPFFPAFYPCLHL